MKFLTKALLMATVLGSVATVPAAVVFPGPTPGAANAEQAPSGYTLSNNILTAKFINRGGKLSFGGMTSKLGPVAKAGDELFIINLQDGQSIKSSGLKAGDVKLVTILAAAIVRTLVGDEPKQREVGLGFLPDQRVHTTPYQKEKL